MDFNLLTPHDLIIQIAEQAKEKRLSINLTQRSLSERSGVSLAVLKVKEAVSKWRQFAEEANISRQSSKNIHSQLSSIK